ncbi:MAG: hypothetical protein JXQ97_02505 [Natronospirillum sp.]
MNPLRLFAALTAVVALPASAQQWQNITLYEPPSENYEFWRTPSPEQAKDLTLLGYQGYDALSQHWRRTKFQTNALSPALLDVGMWLFVLPEPMRWMQNEWQRDLMRQYDIDSASEAHYFWSDTPIRKAYVYDVSDADLAELKAESPATMVRLSTARYEATHVIGQQFAEDSFFNHPQPRYRLAKAFPLLVDIFSFYNCREGGSDNLPRNEAELAQDIVGYECRSWAYDLHRPDADYTDRPNRYLRWNDLSEDEQNYINSAFWFSLLNLLDGHLLADRREMEQNRVSFQPTPFGRSFGWHHLRARRGLNLGWDIYMHQNAERSMPGARVSLIDYPTLGGELTSRASWWQQPEDQQFFTEERDDGWAVEFSYSLQVLSALRLQTDWHYKSAGWMPGNLSFEEGSGWRFGIDVLLFGG